MSRAATTRDRARGGRRGGGTGGDAPSPVTPLRPRRRRSRRPAHPGRRLLVALGAAVLVVGVLAWLVLASPVFAVRTVQVDGEARLSAEQVVQVAGIAEGTPLARVDTTAAAARVAALPQVSSVEVTRGWPSTMVVTLAERVPVAVVTDGGTRRLVDADGVVFETITGTPPDGVVPLEVPDPGPDDAATTAALGALTALPPDVRDEVTGVAAQSPDAVTLTLTDGRSVLWGSAAQTDRKAEVLGALLEQIDAGTLDPAGTLDVSTPDSVVLR
ncbi:cell division protein FtsQ/DivIB [Modestobacter altitudinis]|uniref:cell division protein FtsQ/DivIB n=1 Tax=Modestobacter altitudinis TaxID=2213158 RepID=UPI00110CD7A3|nr:FtsQ-type POTRA domain-containing protein [Modestobacter altitudinis]